MSFSRFSANLCTDTTEKMRKNKYKQGGAVSLPLALTALLSETQLCNDSTISFDILLLEVTKEVTSLTDHLKKTSSGMMVILVDLEMFGQVVDLTGKDSYLYLGRTGIVLAELVLSDDLSFFFFAHHNKYTSLKYFPYHSER